MAVALFAYSKIRENLFSYEWTLVKKNTYNSNLELNATNANIQQWNRDWAVGEQAQ